jgi:hypothetical protein
MDSFPEFREGNGRPSAKGPLSRDPGNTSRDCPLFCVFGRTEVNEKTTRPRTYSPGNWDMRERVKGLWNDLRIAPWRYPVYEKQLVFLDVYVDDPRTFTSSSFRRMTSSAWV